MLTDSEKEQFYSTSVYVKEAWLPLSSSFFFVFGSFLLSDVPFDDQSWFANFAWSNFLNR